MHAALRSPRAELLLSLAGAVVVATTQWRRAFVPLEATGFGDWQMIHHNWEAAYVALVRFGEWPVWDPFHCGGVTILGNPESQLYTPLFWLSFALGTVPASKVFLVLHIAAALSGMYWLARSEYALAWVPAAFAASAWGLSGCFAWDGAGGHATFLCFAYAPWLVLCLRRIGRDLRYVIGCALLLAATLFEGGTYPFPYFLLLSAFELGRQLSLSSTRRLQLCARFALLGVLVAMLGAIRLLPIAYTLHDTPRLVESSDMLDWNDVLLMLTARTHAWRFPPHTYVWPEYGSYVGWPVLLFAVLGALRTPALRLPHLLLGLTAFGLLMSGSRAAYYPWPLLHHLPIYDSLRVPSRFAILFTFYLALLAAQGFDLLLRWRPSSRVLAGVAALGVALQAWDMVRVNTEVVDRWNGPPLSDAVPASSFYLVPDRSYHFEYASYPRRNVGTDVCYVGGMNWRVSNALWRGNKPQARVASGQGQIVSSGRTTRRVFAEVALPASSRVVFNQNYAPGWVASRGEVAEDRGRLAVDLEAGRQRVELRYAPAILAPSALLSIFGCMVSLLLWFRARRAALIPTQPSAVA